MLSSIKDKSVVVTGGSKGIGKGIAKVFAQQGAKVTIVARGQEALEKAKNEIEGNVNTAICDVSDWESVKKMIDTTASNQGGIDIVCANAGIFPILKLLKWSHQNGIMF